MRARTPHYEVHPFALILPEATGSVRRKMKDDIRKHGVRVPVVLFDSKILDGRSRYEIARELGIDVPTSCFRGSDEEALELVASYNLHRRHLKASQRAMVAAGVAQELQRIGDMSAAEARITAAEQVGAAVSSTARAERILRDEPKVATKIRNGKETIGGHLKERAPEPPSALQRLKAEVARLSPEDRAELRTYLDSLDH